MGEVHKLRKSTLRKITVFTLASTMSMGSVASVMAQTNHNPSVLSETVSTLSEEKTNYTYLVGQPGSKHLEYIYESNGITYKVVENASDNFDRVDSVIYQKDDEGNFVEYANQTLTVSNGQVLTLNTEVDGEVSTEVQTLEMPTETISNMSRASYNGGPVSPWVSDTIKGNTKIKNYTVSGVTAVIIYIAGLSGGVTGGLAAAAGSIAGKIVDDLIPIVYYKQTYSQRTSAVVPSMVVASKWDTWYYGKKDYTDYLGYTFDKVYASGYKE